MRTRCIKLSLCMSLMMSFVGLGVSAAVNEAGKEELSAVASPALVSAAEMGASAEPACAETSPATAIITPYIPIERPLAPAIPDIARGYEEVYLRFIKGVLIYKPNPANDEGRVDIPFASFPNPLEGTFDLSRCGDAGRYITFSTGYRKGKKAENANKVEVWITPKFYVERNLDTTAGHLRPVMGSWSQPIGLFWTWGGWDRIDYYDYYLTESLDTLGNENNYVKLKKIPPSRPILDGAWYIYSPEFDYSIWSSVSDTSLLDNYPNMIHTSMSIWIAHIMASRFITNFN